MNRVLLIVVNHAGFFLSHRLPLAIAARERGWNVRVATPASKHVPSIRDEALEWHPIRLTRSGTSLMGEIRTLLDLKRLYRGLAPDLVHHVTTKPVLWGTIAARQERVPGVVNALAGLGHLSLAETTFERILSSTIRQAFRFSLRHPRMKVIFQNEDDREAFIRGGVLAREETVIVPGSGVDPEVFRPSARSPDDVPVIVLPSRMLRTKGVQEFVNAADLLKNEGVKARFVLVGEPDPDNPASITEETMKSWEKTGTVECWGRRKDMPSVYAQADVVCLPSYREGMPKVLIEAAFCGLPAVTTDVPGCRDVVVRGVTGLVVPAKDAAALAGALRALVSDAPRRLEMGARARARACEQFTLSRVVEMTLDLYDEVMA